ncbi:MAG: response regulator [Planctomycetes bacterium]|nr:response regulator [Planctomycetota bacterium]
MTAEQKKIRLLMVDDNVKFLETVSKRLGLKDFDVTAADDGKKAIKAAGKGEFDIALVDLRMPSLDGTEVLKVLKKKHKFLEVVVLTGHATINSAVECTKLGAFDYLEKPYEFDQLLDVLKRAYQNRLRRKFERDEKRLRDLEVLSMGSSPMAILKSLMNLDDGEK